LRAGLLTLGTTTERAEVKSVLIARLARPAEPDGDLVFRRLRSATLQHLLLSERMIGDGIKRTIVLAYCELIGVEDEPPLLALDHILSGGIEHELRELHLIARVARQRE